MSLKAGFGDCYCISSTELCQVVGMHPRVGTFSMVPRISVENVSTLHLNNQAKGSMQPQVTQMDGSIRKEKQRVLLTVTRQVV